MESQTVRDGINSSDPIAVNINFDSMGNAFNYPSGYRDMSFYKVFNRINELAEKYRLTLTFYLIGRDLEDKEIFARVRHWRDMGFEIGNHTWSHRMDFGALNPTQIKDEITRAHDLITRCVERSPRGFIAPNWSTSKAVAKALIDLHYLYDTSPFPSLFLIPFMFKNLANTLHFVGKLKRLMKRKDWLLSIRNPPGPYFSDRKYKKIAKDSSDKILVLPLPVKSYFHPPCWHTIGFVLGWPYHISSLRSFLNRTKAFYYLMHPADFLGPDEIDDRFGHNLQRMNVSLSEKMKRAEQVFELLADSGRPSITMEALASQFYSSS